MARHGHFEPLALRQARLAAGLTQHQLAHLLGVAGGERVSRWELGLSTPRAETLAKAAELLNVDVGTFLGEEAQFPDLRSLRRARGLTISELAVKVHVSKSTVARWESGQTSRPLPPATVGLLAHVLGVPVTAVQEAVTLGPDA